MLVDCGYILTMLPRLRLGKEEKKGITSFTGRSSRKAVDKRERVKALVTRRRKLFAFRIVLQVMFVGEQRY